MTDLFIGCLNDRLSNCKLHLSKIEQVLEQLSSSPNKENEEVELIRDVQKIINQVKESHAKEQESLAKLRFNGKMVKQIQQDFHSMLSEKLKKLTSKEYVTNMHDNCPKRIISQAKEISAPKVAAQQLKSIDLISLEAFNELPKHVKGRLTLEQINNGVVEVNKILKIKQAFLRKPKSKLSLADRKKRGEYSKGLIELKGTKYEIYFDDEDINENTVMLRTMKKTKEQIFLILRNLSKIKEIRRKSSVKYCLE